MSRSVLIRSSLPASDCLENGNGSLIPCHVLGCAVIPPFMDAVDKAVSYLDPVDGILGLADFYTSQKYDSPERQHGFLTRWWWSLIFDLDGIDLGPARRLYLNHKLYQGVYVLLQEQNCIVGAWCAFLS